MPVQDNDDKRTADQPAVDAEEELRRKQAQAQERQPSMTCTVVRVGQSLYCSCFVLALTAFFLSTAVVLSVLHYPFRQLVPFSNFLLSLSLKIIPEWLRGNAYITVSLSVVIIERHLVLIGIIAGAFAVL